MDHIIEVSGLTKSYGEVRAVKGIDFFVEPGKFFAFLGPNGAGKSTTIDILCTLLQYDSGTVEINGHPLGRDDAAIRASIGVVFQDSLLDPLLTVRENLLVRGSFYGIGGAQLRDRAQKAAQAAGVTDFVGRRYGKLSGGQRRRSDIARALVNTPDILFLDEPTTGLDPQTRRNIWETVRGLQQEFGTTVFLTTHYMEEAADADYVVVIDDGLIAAKGTPADIRQRYSHDLLTMTTSDPAALAGRLDGLGKEYELSGNTVKVKLGKTVDALGLLSDCADLLTDVQIRSGTMDDAFIAITGKEIRE